MKYFIFTIISIILITITITLSRLYPNIMESVGYFCIGMALGTIARKITNKILYIAGKTTD